MNQWIKMTMFFLLLLITSVTRGIHYEYIAERRNTVEQCFSIDEVTYGMCHTESELGQTPLNTPICGELPAATLLPHIFLQDIKSKGYLHKRPIVMMHRITYGGRSLNRQLPEETGYIQAAQYCCALQRWII